MKNRKQSPSHLGKAPSGGYSATELDLRAVLFTAPFSPRAKVFSVAARVSPLDLEANLQSVTVFIRSGGLRGPCHATRRDHPERAEGP